MEPQDQGQGPQRPSAFEPRGFFTGVRIRPVIIGAVVDYVATYIIITIYIILYFAKGSSQDGIPREALEKAFEEAMSSPEGLQAFLILGALCTVLGGFVAARIAKAEPIKHGALVGVVSLIIGVLQTVIVGPASPVPDDFQLLGYILAVPAGALGGYLCDASRSLSSV